MWGVFPWPAEPGDRAEKTVFDADNIDISQARAEIPFLPAPL
jgi:hypothetical protein